MKNFTLRINKDLDNMLDIYMKRNKLSSKNQVINNMIEYFVKNSDSITTYNDLDKKLERIIKLGSLNNNLLEQLFCNHGFPINLNKSDDKMLKETYENSRKKFVIFMD